MRAGSTTNFEILARTLDWSYFMTQGLETDGPHHAPHTQRQRSNGSSRTIPDFFSLVLKGYYITRHLGMLSSEYTFQE